MLYSYNHVKDEENSVIIMDKNPGRDLLLLCNNLSHTLFIIIYFIENEKKSIYIDTINCVFPGCTNYSVNHASAEHIKILTSRLDYHNNIDYLLEKESCLVKCKTETDMMKHLNIYQNLRQITY